ncbi:AAA family ATPase [Kribbella solani]|uniref:Putative ATPase n=1 Tax=Kribbella solani TaxID=236067 RepID=A0A841DFR0_9ACTN|nr:putative ATPase [Kribbella solani]
MIIKSVSVDAYRSIDTSGPLQLGPVTVLIGRNNSGKSALLRAMYLAQGGARFSTGDRRLLSYQSSKVVMEVAAPYAPPVLDAYYRSQGRQGTVPADLAFKVEAAQSVSSLLVWNNGRAATQAAAMPSARPNHLFVPVFSRRKVSAYDSSVDAARSRSVAVTDHDLTALISSLSGEHAAGQRFRQLVKRVLGDGASIGTYATDNGQQPGFQLNQYQGVSLDRMGEGVSGVITILAELASPGRRVLLLEEPENDLHPEALHELLNVILEAVTDHGYQVVVSTHSDVVLRTLGSATDAVIYRTTQAPSADGVPTTTYTRLGSAIERREALADLGYDVSAPVGWLIFEESTAERFFREILIPEFVPKLAGFRVLAAGGTGKVQRTFEDLRRFMLFVQKSDDPEPEPRAWVLVDGDQSGQRAATKLATTFTRWPPDRFITFEQPAIEQYYPSRFSDRVTAIETARSRGADWLEQGELKGELIADICAWYHGPDFSRAEIEESAHELIDVLQTIASKHAGLYK